MFHAMKAIGYECWQNRRRMLAVAAYNLNFQHNQTRLKLLWTVINPTLQTLTYWIVFHIGMRTNSPVDGVPYLAWMLTGLVPWFFISGILTVGVNSMIAAGGIIRNMKYPLSTIPVSAVCTELMTHCCFMVVLIVVQLCNGVVYSIHYFEVFYFMLAEFVLLLGYTFLMSTLTVFIRDIQKAIQSLVRLLFFLTPICWFSADGAMKAAQRWNPFTFILEGYRGAMLFQGRYDITAGQHLYVWTLAALILVLGCWLHWRLRAHFIDYL